MSVRRADRLAIKEAGKDAEGYKKVETLTKSMDLKMTRRGNE